MSSMAGKVLLLILTALLPASNGCKALMNFSSSSFASNFSLEELVKNNQSPSGIICARNGLGGGSNTVTSSGVNHSSRSTSSSFSCQIGSASFDETGFIASLKTGLENEIRSSGAKIITAGSSSPAEFYFEYSEGDIHGRISIGGKRARDFYSLEASLDEKREPNGK